MKHSLFDPKEDEFYDLVNKLKTKGLTGSRQARILVLKRLLAIEEELLRRETS